MERFLRNLQTWVYFAIVGGFSLGAGLFCYTLFVSSPNQDSNSLLAGYLAVNNYNGWLQYAIWRTSLMPDFYLFTGAGILFSIFALLWFPFKSSGTIVERLQSTKSRSDIVSCCLPAAIGVLEIEFLAWAYELGGMLKDSTRPPWLLGFYNLANTLTLGNLQPGQDYPFLITVILVLFVTAIKFRSIWKTLQILSFSVIPLPVYVYLFDNGEFFVHFENQFKTFSFITNFDLLLGSISIFALSLLIDRRSKLMNRTEKPIKVVEAV